jgi:hypothetical protein
MHVAAARGDMERLAACLRQHRNGYGGWDMQASDVRIRPIVGDWYRDRESEEKFEVTALDEDEGSIEVQYLDGEIAEFSTDDWSNLSLARTAPPEDWSGALEQVEDGDGGYDPESFDPPTGQRPLSGFEQDEVLLSDEVNSREGLSGSESEEE